jgi:hypothetical protein
VSEKVKAHGPTAEKSQRAARRAAVADKIRVTGYHFEGSRRPRFDHASQVEPVRAGFAPAENRSTGLGGSP